MFFLRLRLANKMEEIASLELVARGVAMKEMKKGEMPEAFEKPLMASTNGSANMAASAAPAIRKPTAFLMTCALEGLPAFSASSSSSLSSSSSKVINDCLAFCKPQQFHSYVNSMGLCKLSLQLPPSKGYKMTISPHYGRTTSVQTMGRVLRKLLLWNI